MESPAFNVHHKRIPPKSCSYNSDDETVHWTIEDEFFDLEQFASVKAFHRQVAAYQAYYNLVRPNMHKKDRSPWQIIKNQWPEMTIELVKLPPIMIDWIGPDYITKEEYAVRGYDHGISEVIRELRTLKLTSGLKKYFLSF